MTKKNANAWRIPALALLAALLLTAALLWAPKAYADYVDPPKFSLAEGCYYGTQNVRITCAKGWCVIYTTDGNPPVGIGEGTDAFFESATPTDSSSVSVPVPQSCVIRAAAYRYDGIRYEFSSIATQAYGIYEPDHKLDVSPKTDYDAQIVGARSVGAKGSEFARAASDFEPNLKADLAAPVIFWTEWMPEADYLNVTFLSETGWEIAYTTCGSSLDLIAYANGRYCPNPDKDVIKVSSSSVTVTISFADTIRAIAYQRTGDGCYRFSPICSAKYADPNLHHVLGGVVEYNDTEEQNRVAANLSLSISGGASCYEEGYTQAEDIDVVILNRNRDRVVIQGEVIEGEHADCFRLCGTLDEPEGITIEKGKQTRVQAVRPYLGLAAGQYAASYKVYFYGTSKSVPFTLTVNAARPSFDLAPGTYLGPQQVSLSTISQGAAIRYTMDGSDPTADSTLYEGPITVDKSTTVKAIACMDDAALNSAIVSAAYTIIQPSYTLELTAPEFDEAEEGYDQPAAKPLTIVSIGNSDASISSVDFLEGGDYFLLDKMDGATVAAGSTDNTTYTVQPAAGLKPGIHRAVVAVIYNNGETAAAELSFTVNERTYQILVEDDERGSVRILGPEKARAGSRVSYMAYYSCDDYQLTEVLVTDEAGDQVETDCWDSFIMPARDVTLTMLFKPLLDIAIETDNVVELMLIQTDSHSCDLENPRAAAGETVKMDDPICVDGYVIASVSVTAEDESDVPCEHYVGYITDEYGTWMETGWRFVMPDQPITVNFVLVPVFNEADFVLPADLEIIAANAFEGDTSISAVDAGGCIFIGAKAFKDCMNLSRIRLPQNCRIAPSAFSGCDTVYVYAPAGGVTESSCRSGGPCVFVDSSAGTIVVEEE